MEALELLVESSDLEIKVGVQGNDKEAATPPVASRTQLTVQLSFMTRSLMTMSFQTTPRKTHPIKSGDCLFSSIPSA